MSCSFDMEDGLCVGCGRPMGLGVCIQDNGETDVEDVLEELFDWVLDCPDYKDIFYTKLYGKLNKFANARKERTNE